MQSPPPPPPPSGGMMPPPPPPGGYMQPPMGGGGAMAGNLASPGLRIVGGLIDFLILGVIVAIVNRAINDKTGVVSLIVGLVVYIAYFTYFWSQRGQSIGMMVFGFKVRDMATGQFPDPAKAALRGFMWWLEIIFTICIIGAIGWLWQLWDPQKQAVHDKVAGTIVTTS
ncbi:MAG TPA: RDD family protein [Candidatus Nitrosopolaris sp.]|nr:RDD family protein [Candidatus Nitrosopolaris sp.]